MDLRLRRMLLVATVTTALMGAPTVASGAAAPVSLTWRTPPGSDCPTSSEVLDQIERLVGYDAGRVPVEATADVRHDEAGRWSVRLTTKMGQATGHRTVTERSCRAMAEATVIILAWMIDPDRMASRQAELPKPSEPEALERAQAAAQPTASRATTIAAQRDMSTKESSEDRSPSLLRLEMVSDIGTLPSFAFGVGARGNLALGVASASPFIAFWPSTSTNIATGPDGSQIGAKLWLASAGIDGCVAPFRMAVAGCAGVELDRIAGRGFGVPFPQDGSATWLSFRGGVDAQFPIYRRLKLTTNVALVVPSRRTRFGIDGVGEVDRPRPIALRAALGLALEL
jgi:hypothetical protein